MPGMEPASPATVTAKPPTRPALLLAGNALLAVAIYLLAGVGERFAAVPPLVSGVWPAAGAALGAVVTFGHRLAPGVFAGMLAYALAAGLPPLAALIAALGQAAAASAGAGMTRRVTRFDPGMTRIPDIAALVLAGGATAAALGAAALCAAAMAAGQLSGARLPLALALGFLGAVLGVLALAPAIAGWPARSRGDAGQAIGVGLVALLAGLFSYAIFSDELVQFISTSALQILLFPVLAWSALRFRPGEVAVTSLAAAAGAVAGLIVGGKALVAVGTVSTLHVFVAAISLTTLTLSALRCQRLAAENALRRSEARFRMLTELSADWFWEQDDRFRMTAVMAGPRAMSRIDHGRSLGRARWELPFLRADAAVWAEHRATLEAHQPFYDLELRRENEDGSVRFIEISGAPVLGPDGAFQGYRGVGRDVTDRKRGEHALRESEQRFRSLLDLSSDWYWEQDERLRFTFISRGISAIGRRPEDYLGKSRLELAFLRMEPEVERQHRGTLAARRPFREVIAQSVDPDGRLHYVQISGEPLFDGLGQFRGYRGIGRDITAHHLAERAVRDREAQLRLITDNVPAMIAQFDADLTCRFANAQYAGFFGLSQRDVVGRHLGAIIGSAAMDSVRPHFARTLRGEPVTYQRREVRGSSARDIEITLVPDTDERGKVVGVVALVTEITERLRSERALRESEQRLRTVVTNAPLVVFALDAQGVFTFSEGQGLAKVGLAPGEAVGRSVFEMYADYPEVLAQLRRGLEGSAGVFEATVAGREFVVHYAPLKDPGGEIAGLTGVSIDITERKEAEQTLRASEQRFRDVVRAAGEYVWETDREWRYTYLSDRVQALLGYGEAEMLGRRPAEFMPAGEAERVDAWFGEHVAPGQPFRGLEHMSVTQAGALVWQQVSGVPVFDADGSFRGYRGTGLDITERKRAEERIEHLATRDPLTGLPNRLLLQDRINHRLANAQRNGERLALLFIDLDRFKTINDSLGHHVGDALLQEVAGRLQSALRGGDTLARLGGDEFVVALERLRDPRDAATVAQKILAALAGGLRIGEHSLNTSCSIGISIFPEDGEDLNTLMRNADTAMYHAKEQGRGNYQFFSADMNVRAVRRLNMETALRRALERGELELHFQPQVTVATGALAGAEALLRWRGHDHGSVSPSEFIPVAEETGIIHEIGTWAMESACRQIAAWQADGLGVPKISVNLSRAQLRAGFDELLRKAMQDADISPSALELEITESLIMQDENAALAILERIGALGVRIAIDDFGAGYSSLGVLRRLPIDTLKIDQSFVHDLETKPDALAVAGAIVAMAHSLKLTVVAEGVERRETLAALAALRCDEYQGFLFSAPLPAAEFARRFLRAAVPPYPVRKPGGSLSG
jgi:diguanylate cyclase (GGDEF)-like protein/PAS domain S-box-containing protein